MKPTNTLRQKLVHVEVKTQTEWCTQFSAASVLRRGQTAAVRKHGLEHGGESSGVRTLLFIFISRTKDTLLKTVMFTFCTGMTDGLGDE